QGKWGGRAGGHRASHTGGRASAAIRIWSGSAGEGQELQLKVRSAASGNRGCQAATGCGGKCAVLGVATEAEHQRGEAWAPVDHEAPAGDSGHQGCKGDLNGAGLPWIQE